MSVYLIDCYEKGRRGERSIGLVKKMINSVFEECGTLVTGCRIKVVVRRLNELSDLLCTWELGDIVSEKTKSCALSFDKVNFFFIAGDLGGLLPWDPVLAPLVTLCHMANVVRKPVFGIGLGGFAGIYSAATLGDHFYIFNNVTVRDEQNLDMLPHYPVVFAKSVPSADSTMSSAPKYQGGWLDSQTGDIYTYDLNKRVWNPEVNVGVHKTPSFGHNEKKSGVGVMHFKKDNTLLSRSIPLESANRRQEVCGIRSKHTQHYAVRDFKQNTFILTPQTTWSINGDASLPIAHHLVALADGTHGPVLLSQGNMLLVNCEVHEDNSYHVLRQIMRNYVSHILHGLFSGSRAVRVHSIFTYLFGADGEGGNWDPRNLVKQRGPCAATQGIPSSVPDENLMIVRLEVRLRTGTSLPISVSPSSSSLAKYAKGELRIFNDDGEFDFNVLLSARPHTSLGKPAKQIARRPTTSQHVIVRGLLRQFHLTQPLSGPEGKPNNEKSAEEGAPVRPVESIETLRRRSIENDLILAEYLAKIEAGEVGGGGGGGGNEQQGAVSPSQDTANSPQRTAKSTFSEGSPADSWAQPSLPNPRDRRINLRRLDSNDSNSEGVLGADELVQLYQHRHTWSPSSSSHKNHNHHIITGTAAAETDQNTGIIVREARVVAPAGGLPLLPPASVTNNPSSSSRSSSHVHNMISLATENNVNVNSHPHHPQHNSAVAAHPPPIENYLSSPRPPSSARSYTTARDPDNKGFGVPANKQRAASGGGSRRPSDASFASYDAATRRMPPNKGGRGSEGHPRDDDPHSALSSARGGGATASVASAVNNGISKKDGVASTEEEAAPSTATDTTHGVHTHGAQESKTAETPTCVTATAIKDRGEISVNRGAAAAHKAADGLSTSMPSYTATSVSSGEDCCLVAEDRSGSRQPPKDAVGNIINAASNPLPLLLPPPKPQSNVAIPGWEKIASMVEAEQQQQQSYSRRQSNDPSSHPVKPPAIVPGGSSTRSHSGINNGNIAYNSSNSNDSSRKNSVTGGKPPHHAAAGPSGYPSPLIDMNSYHNHNHNHSLSVQMAHHLLPRSHPSSCPNSARGLGGSQRPRVVTFTAGGDAGQGAESSSTAAGAAAAGVRGGVDVDMLKLDWSVLNIHPTPSLPEELLMKKNSGDAERSDTSIGITEATKSELLASLKNNGSTNDAHFVSKLEGLERSRYEYARVPDVVPTVVVSGLVQRPFNNLKKFEEIAREERLEDDEGEYKGIYIGGVRSAYEKEVEEYKEAKKKFIAGPFMNHSGRASVMQLRPAGGIRTDGTYPRNPGFITSRRAKLADVEIMRKDEKSKHIAKAWA